MNTLFGVAMILASTACVYAYVEESTVGRKSSRFSTTNWSPKSFAPKIRIRPLGEPAIREDKINVDSNVDGIIRREYSAWAIRHVKVKDVKRFDIFKRNFILQMEMNRKNGEFFLLNEFGDLTKEEYISLLRTSKESKGKLQTEMTATKNADLRVSAKSALPAAPVKRLEDLTYEILESVMESSRKSIAMGTEKARSAEALTDASVQPEEYLSKNVYTSLVEGTQRWKQEEEDATTAQNTNANTFDPTLIEASYLDLLYTPMQPPDDFVLRPALLSAAISSSSETIQKHLFEKVELGWEQYDYAVDFEDDEYFN